MQTSEVMMTPALPPILAIGFGIALLLLIIGLMEKTDLKKRDKFTGIGAALLGVMITVSPYSWYAYLIARDYVLNLFDISVLTLTSFLGGIIFAIGIMTFADSR